MVVTFDEGVIALDSTVDGVDFAALRADTRDNDHTVGGRTSTVTETLSVTSRNFKTASDSGGSNQQTEGAVADPNSRNHSHTPGSLATNSTSGSTALTPSGVVVEINGVDGNIECRTIDGYAPEVEYDWYRNHYHGFSGTTADASFSPVEAKGSSGNTWFWGYTDADPTEKWMQLSTDTAGATHTGHGAGSLRYAALNDPVGCAGPENGVVSVDGDGGTIALGGNVNDIGIAEFKTRYDTHSHVGNTTGNSDTGGGGSAVLRNKATNSAAWLDNGSGSFDRAYIIPSPSPHSHTASGGGTNLTSGAPL